MREREEGGCSGGGDATWLLLLLILAHALPSCDAQSSCPAGTANLDSDGVCHQCWSYVPHFRSGLGQRDVSDTLANNAAGCVRTICFIGPSVDTIVITMETTTTTNMVASCSSEYGCYASCPGVEMPRPAYTQSRTQCPLPAAVSGMAITLNGGLEQGQQAVHTCEPGGTTPSDGDAARTCQAAVAPAVGYSWSGTAPTECYSNHPISSVDQCALVDANGGGGDDGGHVFTNGRYVYYMGDSGVTRTSSDSFTTMGSTFLGVGPTYFGHALFADASRGQIYRLCNECYTDRANNPVGPGQSFTQLQCLDDDLNYQSYVQLPGTYTMSSAIFLAVGEGNVAFFDSSGHWRLMSLPAGCSSTPEVTDLGAGSPPSSYVSCESIQNVQTGYLERQSAGQFTIVLTVHHSTYPLNRYQLPNAASAIANIPIPAIHWGNGAEGCSLSVDLTRNKLYTHTEGLHSHAEPVFACPFQR
eukprot:COSAG02_NODE_1925_length_10344_cov_49.023231_8_plen_471_part_00